MLVRTTDRDALGGVRRVLGHRLPLLRPPGDDRGALRFDEVERGAGFERALA